MKKKYTYILALLGLILPGTSFIFAQNEKNLSMECETSFDFPIVSQHAKNPIGQTKLQSTPQIAMLYDNGPLVNFAGQGSGGADVSALHDGLRGVGYSLSMTASIRLVDDFTVPAGQKWTIDSIAFYSYQTGSTNLSTFSELHLAVRNQSPLTNPNPSTIVWGDTTTNVLDNSYWSGIYRVSSTATLTATNRPIMKLVANTAPLQLTTGTYWLDWEAAGSLASGPWSPPITFPIQIVTGDAIQYNAGTWVSIIDTAAAGTTDDAAQGMPFTIYGSISNGVNEIYNNTNVALYPNPMYSATTITISDNIQTSPSFSFLIYDVIGNLVKRTDNISTNIFTIKRENIPSGVYIYEVLNGNEIIKRGKLSVQ